MHRKISVTALGVTESSPSRNFPRIFSPACATASRRGRPRKPHVPLMVCIKRKMFPRMVASLESRSKRTSSRSRVPRLSLVSVRNSLSRSSMFGPSRLAADVEKTLDIERNQQFVVGPENPTGQFAPLRIERGRIGLTVSLAQTHHITYPV